MKIEIAGKESGNKLMANLVTDREIPALPYTEFNDVLYQRILFKALERCFSTSHLEHTHNPFYRPEEAKELVRLFGKEIFIHHPVEVREYFRGVNADVFRQVETLYCSRVGRSIEMVGKVINLDRIKKELVPIVNEGIWAMCLYLDECRLESLRVDIRKSGTWIGMMVPVAGELVIEDIKHREIQAVVICEHIDQPRVLGFSLQTATDDASGAVKQAFYSALLLKREPNQTGIGGLTWQLPEAIKISNRSLLSKEFEQFCNLMEITIELDEKDDHERPALIDSEWAKRMKGRGYVAEHFDLIFDNYLYRSFGYGSRREQRDKDAKFERLIGYNRDPLWQFPALRNLMPKVASEITANGIVAYRRLKFRSKILQLFVGEPINIVQAPGWQRTAWIYNLDDEIIDYIG